MVCGAEEKVDRLQVLKLTMSERSISMSLLPEFLGTICEGGGDRRDREIAGSKAQRTCADKHVLAIGHCDHLICSRQQPTD